MEFKAEFLDLNLELTTLDKEEVKLIPKMVMNTTNTIKIMNLWTKLEEENEKEKEKEDEEEEEEEKQLNPFEVIATELEFIYPKSKKWFMDNFDPSVLGKILTYVAQTLGGIKKGEKS